MIELQLLWARPGQICLWGTEERRPIDIAALERAVEQLTAADGSGKRHRVFNLDLPGSGTHLVPALALSTRALSPLLVKTGEEDDLCVGDERPTLEAGVQAGDSMRSVARFDRFALELIASGRMIPGLERTETGWRARWRAGQVERTDRERLAKLARALPGSLLAAEPDLEPEDAAADILDHLIDARAREQLRRGTTPPFSGTGRERTDPSLTAWLTALTTPTGDLGPEPAFTLLAERLDAWSSRLGAASTVPDPQEEAPTTEKPEPRTPRRLSVTLKASPVTGAKKADEEDGRLFALDGLCDFEWKIAVGDHRLTVDELRKLAAEQLPLIKSDGRWTVVSPAQVEQALHAVERHGERGRAHAGELLRDSLSLNLTRRTERPQQGRPSTQADAAAAAPTVELETEGWLSFLSGVAKDELDAPRQPAGLRGQLRPYQQRGFGWLDRLSRLGLGACLADDMGLGKTIQLLALLLAERERAEPGRATLLICPVSVVGNWRREAERFAPSLRQLAHHGPDRLKGEAFRQAAAGADLVITSYSIVTRDRELLETVLWDRIVLDEAQNIKSRRARQTQAIRALQARHRIALTGTPVENRLTELHSIMDFLNPGLLGSAEAFKQQIARPIEQWRDPDAAAQLRQATAPFILRRLKTDKSILPDLPEKIEMRTDCLLTREQAALYQAVVDDLMAAAKRPEGIARSGAILAALTRLKQVCNHPAQLVGDHARFAKRSGKLERLEEILEEALAEGDRTLCFTQFSGFGQRLAWHLADLFDCEVPFLHGGSSRQERDEMVARFQSDDGPPIFVLSLRAGGVGLNLTAANQVIHFDRWWNPAVEDQATDRAFRIGQRRNVQVRKLTCVGTLEERIDRLLDRKRDLAEMIVGSGESWLTELDSAQLRELVALGPEAIDLSDGEKPRSESRLSATALAA